MWNSPNSSNQQVSLYKSEGFRHSPVDFRAHYRAYPRSLSLTYGRMTKANLSNESVDTMNWTDNKHQ